MQREYPIRINTHEDELLFVGEVAVLFRVGMQLEGEVASPTSAKALGQALRTAVDRAAARGRGEVVSDFGGQ